MSNKTCTFVSVKLYLLKTIMEEVG